MYDELETLRELLAPTKYHAALWAIGFLLSVAVRCLWSHRRLGNLVNRIRTKEIALWQLLGSPQNGGSVGNARSWSTFRRLRVDQAFARQFDEHIVEEIRGLQWVITVEFALMASLGIVVMYLVWLHR